MKDIITIIEKLKIDSSSKINYVNTKEEICDIIIAAYLSIKRLRCWVETTTFQKQIRYINYKDILSILNNDFNYNYNQSDIKKQSGYIWKTVKQHLKSIQNLENYYNAIIKIEDDKITLKYKELDEKYKDILNRK